MKNYKTKQGDLIIKYLISNSGKHISAQDIKEYFVKEGISVGLTTIYRHLAKLEKEGIIKKYLLDAYSSACFEYIDKNKLCVNSECMHLKCEKCEKLIHFDCSVLQTASQHIYKEHEFTLNPSKTVYYGICKDCNLEENLK